MFKFNGFRKQFAKNLSELELSYQAKYSTLPKEHVKILIEKIADCLVELFRDTNNNYIANTYISLLNFSDNPFDAQYPRKFEKLKNYFNEDSTVTQMKSDLKNDETAFIAEAEADYILLTKEIIKERSEAILAYLYDYLVIIFPKISKPAFLTTLIEENSLQSVSYANPKF